MWGSPGIKINHVIFLVVISCIPSMFTIPAHATKENTIDIQYPVFSTIIYGSGSLIANGTFQDYNSSAVPVITISIDNSQYTPNISGEYWNISLNLASGWHTLTATIRDQTSKDQQTVQFLVLNGHMAIPKMNLLVIKESQVCLSLLKSGTNSSCPTLGELKQYDTSNQAIAGKILQNNDGTWYRTPPQLKDWWNFIDKKGNPVICVECDYDYALLSQAQVIFLEPHGFVFPSLDPVQYENTTTTYWNGTDYVTKTIQVSSYPNTTLDVNFDRYVSPDCLTADIVYSKIMMLDTINYLDNGCKKSNLITNSTLLIPKVPFDYNNPFSSLHYQSYAQSIKNTGGLSNCIIEKCDYKDPYSNSDYAKG